MVDTTLEKSSTETRGKNISWRQRKTSRRKIALVVIYILLSIGAFLVLTPFAWMVSTALKEKAQVFVFPIEWIPNPVVWRNFVDGLTILPFGLYFRNTLFMAGLGVTGTVASSALVGFSFARIRFPGRNWLFIFVLSTMMLPFQVTIIPRYILFRHLGWIDTFKPLIVPWWFGGGPFYIFLMRQFFMTIPLEMDESARIDGCSTFSILWHISLPLAKPALAVVAIFSFVFHWNNFFGPLIFLHSMENRTLSLGLRAFQSDYDVEMHWLMAASLIVVLPLLLLFFFFQRIFIQGIVIRGVKG